MQDTFSDGLLVTHSYYLSVSSILWSTLLNTVPIRLLEETHKRGSGDERFVQVPLVATPNARERCAAPWPFPHPLSKLALLARSAPLPLRPIAFAPDLPRPRHARRQMISRTVLALLILNGRVVHVHVVLDRRHILMPQQFLQAKRVIAQYQVAHREGMPQDMRADALVGDPGSLAKTREEHLYPILGERRARLREKHVLFTCTAPFGQFLFTRSVTVEVVQEVAQAVVSEGDAPFLRAFPPYRDHSVPAVEVAEPQPAQLGHANASVVEQPEDGAVAHGCAIGHLPRLVGWCAGQQELFEFLGLDGLDERSSNLGEHDPIEGVAFDDLASHQPVKESTHRTGIGLDGAFGSGFAMLAIYLAHVGKPGANVSDVHFSHECDVTLFFQERL